MEPKLYTRCLLNICTNNLRDNYKNINSILLGLKPLNTIKLLVA